VVVSDEHRGTSGRPLALDVDASPAVLDALRRIGRVEDLSFSPDNTRIALACLDRNSVALVDVDIDVDGDRPRIAMSEVVEFSSNHFKTPHGVDFLDDERLLVANRYGRLLPFRLPPRDATAPETVLTPIPLPPDQGFGLVRGPGSVIVLRHDERADDGPTEVIVCDNKGSLVTRHTIREEPLRVVSDEVLVRRLLDFPDSVSVTDDDRWLAVSNHDAHVVMVYERGPSQSADSEPVCILRGTVYPHGLRFSPDGGHLVVADSGRPLVHVYARRDGWRGVRYPDASVRVMDDDVFALGRDAESSGPKGMGLDRSGHLLAVTYEKQSLAFFHLCELLDLSDGPLPDDALRVAYEIELLDDVQARLDERTEALMSSRSYRLTRPLRAFNASLGRRRRR
jgi:hypothetical protein